MKKEKFLRIINLLIVFFMCFNILSYFIVVDADSGFDSDWDSGSSSSDWNDSSSSWSNDNDYSSSYSSSIHFSGTISREEGMLYTAIMYLVVSLISRASTITNNTRLSKYKKVLINPKTIIAFTALLLIDYIFPTWFSGLLLMAINLMLLFIFYRFIIQITYRKRRFNTNINRRNTSYNYHHQINAISMKTLSDNEILERLGNDFDIQKFYNKVFEIYRDIQIAWMERDMEPVRHLLSDEMFNMYRMQLTTLIAKNQKNMMEDISYVDAGILSIHDNSNKIEIRLKLEVTCRDYLLDIKKNNVVRGDKNIINDYIYELIFVSSKESSKIEYCPNCGAKLEDAASTKCQYCDSVILKDSRNYTLVSKKMLKQGRK